MPIKNETMKILIVDDSYFYLKIPSGIIEAIPDLEVVGTAENGQIAVEKFRTLKPDIVTLDVEMNGYYKSTLSNSFSSQKFFK